MKRQAKVVGHIGPDRTILQLPSSWAETMRALAKWPEYIYAGRLHVSGHKIKLEDLPKAK